MTRQASRRRLVCRKRLFESAANDPQKSTSGVAARLTLLTDIARDLAFPNSMQSERIADASAL
jgi:hypothetical protein